MRLQPDSKVKVAGKTYAIHGPVYAAMKEYFESIQSNCKQAMEGTRTEAQAITNCKSFADRVLEDL